MNTKPQANTPKKLTPHEHIEECRRLLNLPSRQEARWKSISLKDKKMLMKIADLPIKLAELEWEKLLNCQRLALMEGAHRAAAWVKKLEFF